MQFFTMVMKLRNIQTSELFFDQGKQTCGLSLQCNATLCICPI